MLDNISDPVFGPVFDTVDIGLVVIDADRRVVGWNDWMARISRRPAQQVIGKSFYEIFPDAAAPVYLASSRIHLRSAAPAF